MPELKFLGHACFMLREGKNAVIIDPFLSGNPTATSTVEQIDCQHVLVSHGHDDHLGDAVSIARQSGALIIATAEIARACGERVLRPTRCTSAANIALISVTSGSPRLSTAPAFLAAMPAGSSSIFTAKRSITPAIPEFSAIWPCAAGSNRSMSRYCRSATISPWVRLTQQRQPA